MATIVLSPYMVRHPLGGVIASNLQWIWGLDRLGHDVYVFEAAGYDKSCFDPVRYESGNDFRYGMRVVSDLLSGMGLAGRLCFRALDGSLHGLDVRQVREVFSRCDLLIDRGGHLDWHDEAAGVPLRVFVDPDPGYRQVKLAAAQVEGDDVPDYDAYYTYGRQVAVGGRSSAPRLGLPWRHVFHPVDTTRLLAQPPTETGPFTTVMNWMSHTPVEYRGAMYGMKDVEFERFLDLPARVDAPLEVAVEGRDVPVERLRRHGWGTRSALSATETLDSYLDYIRRSAGEFTVVKEVYRALEVGWFGDRSAAYLAMGRPVVVQDNGLEGVLPLGEGLFAVSTVDEAAEAISAIAGDPRRHAEAARNIAREHLDTSKVLARFLDELGVPPHGERSARSFRRALARRGS